MKRKKLELEYTECYVATGKTDSARFKCELKVQRN